MITIDEIKEELGWDLQSTDQDAKIQRTIDRVKAFCSNYTRNDSLPDSPDLDDVYVYLVTLRLNPDTQLRAGKQSENVGTVSITFSSDLPEEIKIVLEKYTIQDEKIAKAKWY